MNKIAGYRKMLGLTQEELANKIGISRSSFQSKENGKFPFKQTEMKKIVIVFQQADLNVTLDSLFF